MARTRRLLAGEAAQHLSYGGLPSAQGVGRDGAAGIAGGWLKQHSCTNPQSPRQPPVQPDALPHAAGE